MSNWLFKIWLCVISALISSVIPTIINLSFSYDWAATNLEKFYVAPVVAVFLTILFDRIPDTEDNRISMSVTTGCLLMILNIIFLR